MTKPLILLGRTLSEDPRRGYADLFVQLLEKEGCRVIWDRDVEADKSILGKVDGIISCYHFPTSLFDDRISKDDFANLKIISRWGAGVDRIDIAEWRRRGVVTTNTPEAVGDATADLAVALALAASRRLLYGAEIAKSGDWRRWEGLGVDLSGAAVGIVGMGNIGIKVARRMKAFDCEILYHNRHRRPASDEASVGAVFCQTLIELCQRADFIVICCPLNEQTRHLISTQHFRCMKTNAIFINVARGLIVDQEALVTALTDRLIRCAALDVMTPEPLPSDHPLQRLDNCILTPHIGTATEGARRKMIVRSVENVVRGVKGEKVDDVVD